ncbi:prepilin-type N-terminal cleavage/methylation domain-containing protein [Puniceicoccus vermicola]|uniref:prepilin-type N-terminal cleavage/methylation domain-containing protein n=1 Tax=Puniceicoccus vermicola TaxID=388746 RepID=UPI00163A30FD
MRSEANRSPSGFTLVELLIAVAILTFGLIGAYAAISLLGKGSESVISYSEMNSQSRKMLTYLGRDVRAADDISIADETKLMLTDLGGNSITYEYDSENETVSRTKNAEAMTILGNVTDCKFSYYTLRQASTSRPVEVKHVQLQARMKRPILSLTTSDDIVTARFMMRNHEVSN